MRRQLKCAGTWMGALSILLVVACNSKAANPVPTPSMPAGFETSDTAYWRFGYPTGWTTDESTGNKGEHKLNVRGPNVTPMARCFAFAIWEADYPQDLVKATRALILPDPSEQIVVDEEFEAPDAKQALRIERLYSTEAKDGSTLRVHGYELHFLRTDNTAIGFDITVPAGHEAECQADQILKTFTMKPR